MDNDGNDSLSEGHDESGLIDSLMNGESQHDISNTQPTITDGQFNDDDMYYLIKTSFGQLDRKTFKLDLVKHTDTNDLRPIRNSLFDLVKKQEPPFSETKLVERTQRDNGQPIGEKLADDIFVIFQYLEGANNVSELKQCISKSTRRTTTVSEETDDTQIADIIQKLSKKSNCKDADNGIIIAMILEVKQMINDNIKPLNDKINKLTESFEREMKVLKIELKSKENEVLNLNGQLNENREKVTKLQAELKLKAQQMKVDEKSTEVIEQQAKINENITGHLETIERQLKKQTEKPKKTYSEMLTQEQQKHIPVIINSITQPCNDKPNEHNDNRETTVSNNYNYFSNETNTASADDEHIRSDETDDDTTVFRGVVRRRTKRIVLYNVAADKPFNQISSGVRTYAERQGVHVTFTKLLKRHESRGKSRYIMRVNINEDDFYSVIDNNDYFWPKGIYWRDYVPYNNNQESEAQWGS